MLLIMTAMDISMPDYPCDEDGEPEHGDDSEDCNTFDLEEDGDAD